ncbi:MAG TPA: homocysteine S-methyltransferase family protein, partial [Aggregatilineales bacterium]|nr:homocysteine S-methyltransferase family protein [Aggregatilineales bacterium]
MPKQPILEFLKNGGTLVADGAMATLLHLKGIALNASFEHLNITAPEMVQAIHAEYLMAGARLIETNTFGANRYKLAEYGL